MAPSLVIEHCGSYRPEVERALSSMNNIANLARLTAVAGSDNPAYKAMFKNNVVRSRVELYFNQIHDYRGSLNLKPTPFQITLPRVACVTQDSARVYSDLHLGYDPWDRCAATSQGPPRELFHAEGSAYIFICPRFFQKPMAPFGSKCPAVTANLFSGDAELFYGNYQVYLLLYSFIRWYLQTMALDMSSDPVETFNWNLCINYSLLTSIQNPTNYVLYAACR